MRFSRIVPLLALAIAVAVPSTAPASELPPMQDTITVATAPAVDSITIPFNIASTAFELELAPFVRLSIESIPIVALSDTATAHPIAMPDTSTLIGRSSAGLSGRQPTLARRQLPRASTHRLRCAPRAGPAALGGSTALRPPNTRLATQPMTS